MKIKEIMATDVISVSPETSISKVADIMFSNRFHGLPVIDQNKLVGIITEDDFFLKDKDELFLPTYIKFLRENRAAGKLPEDLKGKIGKLINAKAKDIMTPNCQTVSPDMEESELMNLIKKTKYTTFPVTDNNNSLVGIATLSDILGTVRKASRKIEDTLAKQTGKNELNQLASEVNSLWQEKIIAISRHRVRTWKGGLIIGVTAIILTAILWGSLMLSKRDGNLEDRDVLPTTCQQFAYSEWSPCGEDGKKIRTIIKSLPVGCEGGAPILTQSCR